MRLVVLALALPFTRALPQSRRDEPAPFKADIRADTNRDGTVDIDGTTDVNGKESWSEASGALFLANIGDTGGHCFGDIFCTDASKNVQWAPKYMAPMRTVPIPDISDSAIATIAIRDPVARSKVRIFLDSPEKLVDPPPPSFEDLTSQEPLPPVETLQFEYLENDTPIPAAKLRKGLTLGIDARDTRRPDWDGKVTVEFTVKDGSSSSVDKVMLRVSPVLAHHHLQPVEKVFVTKKKYEDTTSTAFQPVKDGIQKSMTKAGIAEPLAQLDIQYTWAQDVMEPGYASMPGPAGPITMRVLMNGVHVPDGGSDASEELIAKLRQDGVAALVPARLKTLGPRTLEAGGNIESIPPYELNGKKYPAGRIVMGGTDNQKPEALSYFQAQEVQDPILLDSTWLFVKHVDEMMQFLPATTERGWRVAVLDPMMGYEAMAKLEKDGHGDVPLTSHTDAQNATYPTVREFLADKSSQEAATYSAKRMELNLDTLKRETGVSDADIVRLPALFAPMSALSKYLHVREKGGPKGGDNFLPLNSVFPSQVNGVPLSASVYLAPKPWGPVVGGEDVFQRLSAEAYAKAGLDVDFLDEWDLHLASGDLHCVTNTYRSMSAPWW